MFEGRTKMKVFDPNYKLLDEMYRDEYFPDFLVDKVKDELQKVIALLELPIQFMTCSKQHQVMQNTCKEIQKVQERFHFQPVIMILVLD